MWKQLEDWLYYFCLTTFAISTLVLIVALTWGAFVTWNEGARGPSFSSNTEGHNAVYIGPVVPSLEGSNAIHIGRKHQGNVIRRAGEE